MISDRVKASLKREFIRSRMAQLGLILVVLVLVTAMLAPMLSPHDPNEQRIGTGDTEDKSNLPPLSPVPGHDFVGVTEESRLVDPETGEFETLEIEVTAERSHPLGTNSQGQDILSRIIYGARVSMLVGLLGTAMATLVGVIYGLIAGYFGGRLDDVLMRAADVMLAFPSLVLALTLIGVFRESEFHTIELPDPFVAAAQSDTIPSILVPRADHMAALPESTTFPVTVTLVVAIVNWVWFARIARGEAISIRTEEYVKAARSLGASHLTILRQHVLPNAMTPIIVLATVQVAFIILLEASLSFLGFSGTSLTWGADVQQGRDNLATHWWISMLPGLAIVAAVIGVNLLGDWLRDALDPGIEGESGGV